MGIVNEIGNKRHPVFTVFCLITLILLTDISGLAAQSENRKRIVLAYSTTSFYDVDVKDAGVALNLWSQEIGRQYGHIVETVFFDDSSRLLANLQTGKVDFAVLRADDYLRIVKTPDFKEALTIEAGGKKTQQFSIIVPSASPYQTLKDLKDKKLAMFKGDTLTALYLNNLLMKARLPEMGKHFSIIEEKAKSSQALLSVFFGQFDVCVVNERSYETAAELNPQLKAKLRIIGKSPEFLMGMGIIRDDLDPILKEHIKNTLLKIGDTTRGKQIMSLFKCERFALSQPSDLDSIRKIMQENEQGKTLR